jgi:Tol biopolymer transport system component
MAKLKIDDHPTAKLARQRPVTNTGQLLEAEWLRQVARDCGADDVGLVLKGETRRVSGRWDEPVARGESQDPAISLDGRFVAFDNTALAPRPGEIYIQQQIYIRNLTTDAIELVSTSIDGTEGNLSSMNPALSADGRFVAFASITTNLVADDHRPSGQFSPDEARIYVRDRDHGVTKLISVTPDGTPADADDQSPYRFMRRPAISTDGRFVAFVSGSTNLVSGDSNGFSDVFVRDCSAGRTERVSVSSSGAQANDESISVAISGDGRFVAFGSLASNLVPGDADTPGPCPGPPVPGIFAAEPCEFHDPDIFVRDRERGVTTRLSIAPDGSEGDSWSWPNFVWISANGRLVAFESTATNLARGSAERELNLLLHERLFGNAKPPHLERR